MKACPLLSSGLYAPHSSCNCFGIFSVVLARKVIIKLFASLNVERINEYRLHSVILKKLSEFEPIMSCRLHIRHNCFLSALLQDC